MLNYNKYIFYKESDMKKTLLFTFLFTCALTLSSCGKDTEEILAFQNKLNSTIMKIESLNNELNSLDATASDATKTALNNLSKLDDAFEELANIEITDDEFAYLEELADEGADYMSQAYDLYEFAYAQGYYDAENAELAYKYLERATTRVRVIVSMLHGEVPDDVIVH